MFRVFSDWTGDPLNIGNEDVLMLLALIEAECSDIKFGDYCPNRIFEGERISNK